MNIKKKDTKKENMIVLRGTQKNRKIRKSDKMDVENLVGPEYPGEGAMNNILIAGSTDIQEKNNNFLC